MGYAVEVCKLGKMYRLFEKQSDRVMDIFGVDKLRFWDRTPRYKEFWALRNVDLSIPQGERIGIIGRNGAGKSTLLKLVVGNLRPTEGTVAVRGKIQALLQMGTGFHPEFTGLENIRTALAYAGMDSKAISKSVDEIIDFSELEDYIHQPVKYYSAGMYSRLAFAVATSLVPDILIIDEVLGAGDAAFTSKCADRMKHLTQDSGATVLFVSHSMDSVLEICNRAILIERGEIVEDGTALEVSKIYNKKIREEEELRAKAKEYKISRKNMLQIATADEATQVLIMHFVCDTHHPQYAHSIYDIELKSGGKQVSKLHFGAPTDDDPSQFSHVITDKGSDWGPAKKDRQSFYRAYSNQDGANCHAPFQMAVPIHMSADAFSVTVNARPDSREPIFLEYFDGHEYRRLGRVEEGRTEFEFQISSLLNGGNENLTIQQTTVEENEQEQETKNTILETVGKQEAFIQPEVKETVKTVGQNILEEILTKSDSAGTEGDDNHHLNYESTEEEPIESDNYEKMLETNSVYGSEQIVIKKVDILNGKEESKRSFVTGEKMKFRISIGVNKPVPSFIGVVCIMTRDGKVAAQTFCESKRLGLSPLQKDTTLDAEFSPLRLGEGEYMVSIGLFQTCDMSRAAEEPSYCVADRALFFKVDQPFGVRKYLGSMLHPCDWMCGQKQYRFDGTDYKEDTL